MLLPRKFSGLGFRFGLYSGTTSADTTPIFIFSVSLPFFLLILLFSVLLIYVKIVLHCSLLSLALQTHKASSTQVNRSDTEQVCHLTSKDIQTINVLYAFWHPLWVCLYIGVLTEFIYVQVIYVFLYHSGCFLIVFWRVSSTPCLLELCLSYP